MSLLLIHGRPALSCDKCFHRFGVTELLVIKWADLENVSLMCEPCAQALEESWAVQKNGKTFEATPALRYFQQLVGGRTVQPKAPDALLLSSPARRFVLPPPSFSTDDVG